MRTIYSPNSNQTYIRIKPNQSVISILERGGLFSKNPPIKNGGSPANETDTTKASPMIDK